MIVVAFDCVGFCFSVNFRTASPYVVGGVHQEVVEHTEKPATGIHVHIHVVIVVDIHVVTVLVVLIVVVVIVVVVVVDIVHNVADNGGSNDACRHEGPEIKTTSRR